MVSLLAVYGCGFSPPLFCLDVKRPLVVIYTVVLVWCMFCVNIYWHQEGYMISLTPICRLTINL